PSLTLFIRPHTSSILCLLFLYFLLLFSTLHFLFFFFFFNDTATTEIYTLSLHDALPIFALSATNCGTALYGAKTPSGGPIRAMRDRKSTRLNSSHRTISYAVFCLKKKKKKQKKKKKKKQQKKKKNKEAYERK